MDIQLIKTSKFLSLELRHKPEAIQLVLDEHGWADVEELLSKGRQHVHLSGDEKTVISVGKRHGKPVVLVIKSGEMTKKGYKFYQSANGVWLTDNVPVEYISFPAKSRE